MKILSLFLFFFAFKMNAQRDSIVHFIPINTNVSDVALSYINFYPGFEFVPSINSFQSMIVLNSGNHNLVYKKNSASIRNFIYSNGKLRKVVNNNSEGVPVAYDTLYYEGDTLKKYINHIISANVYRTWEFYYDKNSSFPTKFKRSDQLNSYHFLKFNLGGQLLEDIYAQTLDNPFQKIIFTYNNLGNIILYQQNNYNKKIIFQEHDTSYGIYSASLSLKLYAYSKGLSDYAFSQNNPLKYTETSQGETLNVIFTNTYNLNGYPIKVTYNPSSGVISSEEFIYN